MKPELTINNRTLTLQRYPQRQNETLQAWDSADEYLINHAYTLELNPQRPIVVLNDQFGALSCFFTEDYSVTSITDSHISMLATRENVKENQLANVNIRDSLSTLPAETQLVLFKLPKNNRLLVWQLQQLCHQLPADCIVIAAAKAKDIHSSTLKLFEKYLGETTTSLAIKKSRLIFCDPNVTLAQSMPEMKTWDVPEHAMTLANHANVFSGESLDLGGRFLLDHIPADKSLNRIIDLGCGNGVIGIKAARLNPQAHVLCIDESYMAVASCLDNAKTNLDPPSQLQALVNNCLDGLPDEHADLIL